MEVLYIIPVVFVIFLIVDHIKGKVEMRNFFAEQEQRRNVRVSAGPGAFSGKLIRAKVFSAGNELDFHEVDALQILGDTAFFTLRTCKLQVPTKSLSGDIVIEAQGLREPVTIEIQKVQSFSRMVSQ